MRGDGVTLGRRLVLGASTLLLTGALSGCDPRLCTIVEAQLGAQGCGEEARLNSPPEIDEVDIPLPIRPGNEVIFKAEAHDPDGDRLYFEWDLDGDGDYEHRGYEDNARVVQVYQRTGRMDVKLRVSDFPDLPGGEGVATYTRRVRVATVEQYRRDRPPVAAFTIDPNPLNVGGSARFDASASSDPDGERLYYEWFFGKTFPEVVGQEPVANRTFTAIGEQRVLLRVFDEYGKYDDVPQTLRVIQGQEAPLAALDIEPNPVLAFDNVTFSARRSTDPNHDIYKFQWDLDGVPGYEVETDGSSTTRYYDNPGSYPVTVRVVDLGGRSSTATGTVQVNPRPSGGGDNPPTAVLGVDPNPARTGQQVSFSASESSDPDRDIASYDWDLDGNESFELHTTSPSATRTYSSPGTLMVNVRVNDAAGNSDVASQSLQVNSAPSLASLGGPPLPVRAAAKRNAKLGKRRAFSARLSGKPRGAGLSGAGSFRASLSGPPKLSVAERALKRFLGGRWHTRLRVAPDAAAGRATVSGLALATPARGRDRACIRLAIDIRAGELPRGTFKVIGGTRTAARLYGRGSFRFRVAGNGPAVALGDLRTGRGRARHLPRACAALVARPPA